MDILNFLFLKKQDLIRTEANDAKTDLLVLGASVSQTKRDDQYQTYGLPLADAVVSADKSNTEYYTVDLNVTSIVPVTTQKGVIEVFNLPSGPVPLPGFASAVPLIITNDSVDFTDADRVYMQTSLYYNPLGDDNFVPYFVSTGFLPGISCALYNASPIAAGSNQGSGKLYIYFELYNF
jgi:hypothetical protein